MTDFLFYSFLFFLYLVLAHKIVYRFVLTGILRDAKKKINNARLLGFQSKFYQINKEN